MRDLLVRYLLRELSGSEREALEAQLANDFRLRDELERLRLCMMPEDAQADSIPAPPRNLLDRTVKCVSDSQSGDGQLSVGEPPTGRCHFSLVDGIVAVGIVFAISMLLLPALRESRDISRRTACQNNLRQLGVAFVGFSQDNLGRLPVPNFNQNAGVYAANLADSGQLDRHELMQILICPASPMAEAMTRGNFVLRIPRLEELAKAAHIPPQVRATMGGSYACRVGYMDGKVYVTIFNHSDCRSPILSDAPAMVNLAASSPHHGGCGQNVLFEDGHVSFVVGQLIPTSENHLFLNDAQEAAVGLDRDDYVMGRSDMIPGIRAVPTGAIPAD